jgi:hypothetical protein
LISKPPRLDEYPFADCLNGGIWVRNSVLTLGENRFCRSKRSELTFKYGSCSGTFEGLGFYGSSLGIAGIPNLVDEFDCSSFSRATIELIEMPIGQKHPGAFSFYRS